MPNTSASPMPPLLPPPAIVFCCEKQKIKAVVYKVHHIMLPDYISLLLYFGLLTVFITVLYFLITYEMIYLGLVGILGNQLKAETLWVGAKMINTVLLLFGVNEIHYFIQTVKCNCVL